jgi:hypothetical protein
MSTGFRRMRTRVMQHFRRNRGRYAGGIAAGVLATGVGAVGGQVVGHHRTPPPVTASSQPAPAGSEGAGAATGGGHCGVERWDVKSGTDAAAQNVNLDVVQPTTVAAMDALRAPSAPTARVQPTETTEFQIKATMSGFKQEGDSDYHIVITDGRKTLIVEIPSPNCVATLSPFRSQIVQARAEFDARFTASPQFQNVSIPVTVTGIGFFDRIHGQTGVAPNGVELHPVLDITF